MQSQALELFNSKEREKTIRIILNALSYKILSTEEEKYFKTLFTYEWCLPTNDTTSIVIILEIIDAYGSKIFPITVKLFNMFKSLDHVWIPSIRIHGDEMLMFYIDLGYDINAISGSVISSILLLRTGVIIRERTFYHRMTTERYHYVQSVMITF
jgi:hypothetical protein